MFFHLFLLMCFVCLLLIIVIAVYAYKKRESPIVAAEQLEQDAETYVDSGIHQLDADVIDSLHMAELHGTLSQGTTQAVVDAHVNQVDAVTASITTEAKPATVPAI